jgi:hypothetical protein
VTRKAAITVLGDRAEVERRWRSSDERPESATFMDAPGDRGTEIHVETGKPWTLAKTKEELRRFKQQFETGEIPRSDGAPEGDRVERLLTPRPAQPLPDSEREKVTA